MLSAIAMSLVVLGAGSPSHVYALIVSENRAPEPTSKPLRYADDDGVRYYELFASYADRAELLAVLDDDTQRQHRGVAERTITPPRANVARAFESINASMRADSVGGGAPVFYFIYTGHGGVSGEAEGFVTLHDGKLTRTQLYESMVAKSAAAYNHLIIDACDSYFFVNARGGWKNDRRGAPLTSAVEAYASAHSLESYPNTGVLVSTSKAAESHEWSRYSAGVFSHEVRSGLVGSADANADGRIEYSEIAAYVAAANVGLDDPRARLEVYAKPPQQHRAQPLFDLRHMRTGALLRFDRDTAGHYAIEDERGVRFADFHKAREDRVVIGVLPGRAYYVRHDGEEAFVQRDVGGVVAIADSGWRPQSKSARDATSDMFDQHLYSTAYGTAFYRGFVATSDFEPARAGGEGAFPEATTTRTVTTEQPHALRPWAIGFTAAAGAAATAAVITYAVRDDGTTTVANNGNGNGNGRKTTTSEPASMTPTYILAGTAAATGITALVLFLVDNHRTASTHVAPITAAPLQGGALIVGNLAF